MATSIGILAALVGLGVVGATATGMVMSGPGTWGGTSGGGMMGGGYGGGGMMGGGGGMMGSGDGMMGTGGCGGMDYTQMHQWQYQYQYQNGTGPNYTDCPYYVDANGDGICDYHQTGMTCPCQTTIP